MPAVGDDDQTHASTLLQTLTTALAIDRAALLLPVSPDGRLVPVATVGRVHLTEVHPGHPPGDGPWSAILPVPLEPHGAGLLLLARGAGAPLSVSDESQAMRVADAVARLADHGRVQADLARARTLLARADRLAGIGTLSAGLAHEIRNPLVSVRTFLQLLPERYDDVEFRTGFRELALSEVERICDLITDLLGFAKPRVSESEPVDVNAVVTQTVRLLEPELRRQGVDVAVAVDDELPPVVGDDGQVRQVAMNLIANAIEACNGSGMIEVSTRRQEHDGRGWAVFAVADTGPGIHESHAPHLFDPFFTTKPEGNGLGLYIVRQIVTEHGGQIRTAQRDGGGTLFEIHFPLPAERRDGGG